MPAPARPLAAFCTLLSPFVPLVFMGEEYGEDSPFQFFSDHIDEEIARATREGRRAEFAAFESFSAEEVPDPQDPATFERSKLTRRGDPALASLYRELLAVRLELPRGDADEITFDDEARWLRVRRGRFELVCNFSPIEPLQLRCEGVTIRVASSTDVRLERELHLPPLSGALLETER
jgi:maltooligosyltrehalose trehalohydrolase